MLQRATSDATASSTPRRLRGALKRLQSLGSSAKDGKSQAVKVSSSSVEVDPNDRFAQLRPAETNGSSISYETSESNHRELQALIQRMRSAPSSPNHVDAAYKEFSRISLRCSQLCSAILQDEIRPPVRSASDASDHPPRRDSTDPPRSPAMLHDHRSSFSGRSLAEVLTGSGAKSVYVGEPGLGIIRDWKNCLETLADAFKTNLADTYKNYERDATPDMVDLLFSSKKFRKDAVNRMRNASVTRVMSADPQFFPRYEIRFRNYEKAKDELVKIRQLLQSGESGISPTRRIDEFTIAARGDSVLEFANIGPGCTAEEPVLRFRVSSYMLAETSPIFARMFSGHLSNQYMHEDDDILAHLPPQPTTYICKDGSAANLYRMPQHEVNRLGSLEILLHAGHMHNDQVPREVSFDQLVAIAECSIKYKSTSPIEPVVENRWLPQWMHKGADEMPDGLLVIAYAFGLRGVFARISKTSLLNLVDEKELQTKIWPQRIKDKIWAVRQAKVAQLYACCANTIQEYLRQPVVASGSTTTSEEGQVSSPSAAAPVPMLSPSTTPRCPKGSHACDAANLGWMMLMFNELNLLEHVLKPESLSHFSRSSSPSKSLLQMIDGLKRIPSPPNPIHGRGVCDPCVMFKSAVTDIYNSVTGLTLHDVSGKSHGWALSKNLMSEPHNLLSEGLNGMDANDHNYSVVHEFPDSVRLQVLSELSDFDDLHHAAMINRAFYDTYKRNELHLIRSILRASKHSGGSAQPLVPRITSNAEEKVLKTESDELKEQGVGDGADALTLRSEDDEAFPTDDEDDDDDDDIEVVDTPTPGGNQFESVLWAPPPRHVPDDPPEPDVPPHQHRASATPTPVHSPASYTAPSDLALTIDTSWRNGRDEPPMTEDEARRILWPDAAPEETTPVAPTAPLDVEAAREKFLASDLLPMVERYEDKTLVTDGQKLLGSDLDSRIGLKKGQPETGTSEGCSSKET
ncbi:hypothetical protein B0I35DRAFT_393813 [Stachybotrys elegans]|uniref:BTB domain-containing protein n=1 Tax=Stachybotrys elegans TaxID=80388 RepID=A0A8K0SKH4_9HYPO|nr:hypothetical protein B0I35DRAFT_393813 [Stachybotrys elegans]